MQQNNNTYTLLTFYKFVDIEEPMPLVDEHRQFCNDVGLRGRIYIGEEGISATVTGNWGQIRAYRLYLDSIPVFRDIPDIDIKATAVDGHKFDKMIVRYRREIVALGAVYKASDIENSKVKMPVGKFKEILDVGGRQLRDSRYAQQLRIQTRSFQKCYSRRYIPFPRARPLAR